MSRRCPAGGAEICGPGMLAIGFLFPAMLMATWAAGAPVVIHLIMRTRPRRVVFPPLRFVRKTHRATAGKLKLKHLILLAMRAAAIVLIAVLLARAEIREWRRVAGASAKAAVVVVVDNSGSMGYRYHGKTLLALGKQLGAEGIGLLPEGSEVAVITSSNPGAPAAFHGDRQLARQQLADVPAGLGHQSLAAAIARAEGLLAGARLERKELYIVTDMTAQAWRDGAGRSGVEGIHYTVLNCGRGGDVNVALERLELSSSSVAVGEELAIRAAVRSARIGGDVPVRLEVDGRAVDRKTIALASGGVAEAEFTYRPSAEGVIHGRVVLEHRDPLAMDNVRYFTVQVGRAATMLVVRDAATVGRGGQIARLMADGVAPPPTGARQGRWLQCTQITDRRLPARRLDAVDVVLLAGVAGVPKSQWRRLESYVRGGGSLWVVVGPLTSPQAYNHAAAQRVLPAALNAMEEMPEPIGWQTPSAAEPLLPRFAERSRLTLAEVRCRRRFGIQSVAPGARVVLRYADSTPAAVVRTLGAGQVLLWNFAPIRSFSNLAPQVEFPILARHTARALTATEQAPASQTWGSAVAVPAPRSMPAAVATVRGPGQVNERPVLLDLASRSVLLQADRLGHWTVRFTEADRQVQRGFSVNADPAESRLEPAGNAVSALFPAEALTVASDQAELAKWIATVSQPLDLAAPILLILLVLIAGESFFANRFYRVVAAPGAPGAAEAART